MDNASFAKRRLVEASRTKDATRRLALLCATGAAAILVLLISALVDYWLILPMLTRVGGVVLVGTVLAAGVYQVIRTFRKPTHLKEVALDAEAQRPDAGCELSTAAEYLAGERKPAQEYETELAAALEAKAAAHLKTVQVPYWNKPVRPALFLGAFAVAMVLFAAIVSGGFTAFKRAAAPWSATPYTRVEVKPGDIEIPLGKDVEIRSVFSGRVPKVAQFHWQDSGAPKWQFAALTRNEQGEYVYPLKNVRTSLSYRVTGSDAVSTEYKVHPYVPPEVREWRVELDLPAYAKRPKSTQNSPEITALRGTTASMQITPSTKLSKARLRFEDLPPVDLKAADNGFWIGEVKITKDTKFWVELADEKGRTGATDAPFLITALPDNPPKVEIPDPGQDTRADATNTVSVKISATDDYGLQEIKLVYNKLGGPEQFVTAKRDGETNTEFTAEIPLSSLGLEQYELVAYHAEASDNNTLDGPGIGKSDVYFVEITNEESGKCKCQGKGQRVNLLVIQKQIIADTTALAAKPANEQFEELAKRQKDAVEFGKMYTEALALKGAGEALAEMKAAISEMENAQTALEKASRTGALPPEESALARLYKVIKLMPELQDLPTTPPKMQQKKDDRPPVLSVVLDAIKKKKEQPENQELEEALNEAEQLRDEQAALNIGSQNSGDGSGKAETQMVRASSESKAKGEGKAESKKPAKGKGKGKAKAGKAAKSEPKKGEPKDDQQKKGDEKKDAPNGDGKNGEPQDSQELAEKQEELSEEATALAEKLARMAGKNARLGHNAGGKVQEASTRMKAAAKAMAQGNMRTAGVRGSESNEALDSAIAELERVLNNRPERTDVSKEDAPKEYEMIVAEYLKKLSHED